jgi:hypothetical protein
MGERNQFEERRNDVTRLHEDADSLVALAEGVATILAERRDRFGISAETEALLRASIGAATFAIDAYLAVLAGSKKSPATMNCLAAARVRCDRKIEQLRRRLRRSIAQMCRLMDSEDLMDVAEYVMSLSA